MLHYYPLLTMLLCKLAQQPSGQLSCSKLAFCVIAEGWIVGLAFLFVTVIALIARGMVGQTLRLLQSQETGCLCNYHGPD